MAKKIRVELAPCAELKLNVTDEMIRDYKECGRKVERESSRDCDECSWEGIQIGHTGLCCLLDLGKVLEGENKDPSKDPQEEAPPPTGKRRGAKRAVDVGKLIALHNAGWPVPKIADELGVSERTVYRYLPSKE